MKESKFDKQIFALLQNYKEQKIFSPKYYGILKNFYLKYKDAIQDHVNAEIITNLFAKLLDLISQQMQKPYLFSPYHEALRKPFDYYRFGLDFIRPLIDFKNSYVLGWNSVEEIDHLLKKGDNVVLFSNHQTETDPQLIDLLLQEKYPTFGESMIFVAGERVVLDPSAIPFSLGRNLLCIYSKRYIDNPPEKKLEKQQHNRRTMRLMSDLLKEGGKTIYVAPSGGRDRKDENNHITPASFDPQSVEMFYLMAKKASHPTHFYPLALKTYDLLPPPDEVQKELGEFRHANFAPIAMSFGEKIQREPFSEKDKSTMRKRRAEYIHNLVVKDYEKLQLS